MVQGVEENNQCTPSSLEKLWLSYDVKVEWETQQQMPSSSDLERNNFFSRPHFTIVDYWEKLKCVENLKISNLRIFFYGNDQAIGTPTHCDDDSRVVEQRI